jgi:nucleotide-binding universal stress UspA family protein
MAGGEGTMIDMTRILCPVDFSDSSRRALDHAAAVAGWYGAGITVLHVFPIMPVMDVPPLVLEERDRNRLTADLLRFTAHLPATIPIDHVVQDATSVHEEILKHARALSADLVVLGSHGRSGLNRLLLGSVTERVMRKAPCPTLVVPPAVPDRSPAEPVQFRRILCPIDFSEGSARALEFAMTLAEEADAQIELLHVIEALPELSGFSPPAGVDLDRVRAAAEADRLRQLRALVPDEARSYCTVTTAVREGGVYGEILTAAAEHQADVIVMGVQGRGAVDLLIFGSNTARVARRAACPVLIVGQVHETEGRDGSHTDFDRRRGGDDLPLD